MAERPRILLVPMLTELEWPTKPLIEEWADVASFDLPGVGMEPPVEGSLLEAAAQRALEELDRRGWERAVVVADESVWKDLLEAEGDDVTVEPALRQLDAPLLLARHEACLLWTDEGYSDAIAAFPEAATFSSLTKPSIDPGFVRALRDFCERLPG